MHKKWFPISFIGAFLLVLFSGQLNAGLILSPEDFQDHQISSLWERLVNRVQVQPFNLVAFCILLCAIVHIFFTNKINLFVERYEDSHKKIKLQTYQECLIEILRLLGEVEVVFGIWSIPLIGMMTYFYNWDTALHYLNGLDFTEPLFVIVIMIIASTAPIVELASDSLEWVAKRCGSSIKLRWFVLLTLGPLLGSFITEPGAMTLTALLLSREFYVLKPLRQIAYATLGLLFVNISVGGVLTNFAAPPVLMVANQWNWSSWFMLTSFGINAVVGILIANISYLWWFWREFERLQQQVKKPLKAINKEPKISKWIILANVIFLTAVVLSSHWKVLFLGIFMLFLGFFEATAVHQKKPLVIKQPILVGFFLAGLVVHGDLQGWWVAPILEGSSERAVIFISAGLSAFVDNAGITYLTSLVPNLSDGLKYAVVAGAVSGGGMTVIANAPNPVGQTILRDYFSGGIMPLYLALAALWPTLVMLLAFSF